MSKGIFFGLVARNTDGSWNTSAVEGLPQESTASTDAQHPPSLLILPFSQAGAFVSLRVFTINASTGTTACGQPSPPNGYIRTVTNQVFDNFGNPYQVAGATVADQIIVESPNDLGVGNSNNTGQGTTNSSGQWTDYYSVCSSVCYASTGQTVATQQWYFNGILLPGPLHCNTNVTGSRSMDIKVGRPSLVFIIFFGVAAIQCAGGAAQTEPSMDQQSVSPLSRQIARISIQPTTLLDALIQIGQSSHQCLGIVLVQRSAASAEISSINAESITVGDLLARLLENTKPFKVKEEKGCIVIAPDLPPVIRPVTVR